MRKSRVSYVFYYPKEREFNGLPPIRFSLFIKLFDLICMKSNFLIDFKIEASSQIANFIRQSECFSKFCGICIFEASCDTKIVSLRISFEDVIMFQ